MALDASATAGHTLVALDSCCFIYAMEQHPVFAPRVLPYLAAADRGELTLVTSTVTLLEVLVVPHRAGDRALASAYENILTRSRGLRLLSLDPPLVRLAARIRARHQIRTPDALQLAAALAAGCSRFLTNDRRLPSFPGLEVRQLSELASELASDLGTGDG